MLDCVQAYNDDQTYVLSEIYPYDDFSQYPSAENGDGGIWLSPDDSSDSPSSSSVSSSSWCCFAATDIKQEPETNVFIKQEQPYLPSPTGIVKIEPVSDCEAIADDECKQESLKPLYPPTPFPNPPVNNASLSQERPLPPPTQPTFFQTTIPGADAKNKAVVFPQIAVERPVADASDPVMTEKKVKPEIPVRHRSYKHARLSECITGSPPLPPNIELPAILGGKLPPRSLKSSARKKHVFTERELRIRRKRGLPDDSDSESEERRLVRLPRRSLLAITTPQMSHFVEFMRTTIKLTPSQDDELSKQKRLVKNRECACRFRANKELSLIEYRERVTELEGDLEALRAENERLRQALSRVSASNEFLQQQQ